MHPDNLGNQFNEIMGKNISPKEESSMQGKAMAGHIYESVGKILGYPTNEGEVKAERHATAYSRMRKFPSSMIKEDDEGSPKVEVKKNGWTHSWSGGPYIDHIHPTQGAVDVTNLHDYSKKDSEQGYASGKMSPAKFMKHVNDFHKESAQDY